MPTTHFPIGPGRGPCMVMEVAGTKDECPQVNNFKQV